MRIGLVPLDERPVNTSLPVAVGQIAGAQVVGPPAASLPSLRQPGRCDDLVRWVEETASERSTDALVLSADMLAYGGLIASRTTADGIDTVTNRLGVLRRVRGLRPELPVAAVSLVMRATDSYSATEEPEYWSSHGRELHRLGALLHRTFLGDPGAADELAAVQESVPVEVRADFLRRRLRNHAVNTRMLDLAVEGVVSPLLLTADDTAVHAAGSLEQRWLGHWTAALPSAGTVLMYPGADEVGAVLVARSLAQHHRRPVHFTVSCAEPGGLDRVAPYENNPVGTTVQRQITAAGGLVVGHATGSPTDVHLVVHAPSAEPGDWVRRPPQHRDEAAARATAQLVVDALEGGHRVALADVRYPNGADPALVEELAARGVLLSLTAYAGWNTAGNTIGTVVATAIAQVVGAHEGTLDTTAAHRFLLHRILEDYAYQAVVRTRLVADLPVVQERPHIPAHDRDRYTDAVATGLQECLGRLSPPDARTWQVQHVRLPWQRSFEVDFNLEDCRKVDQK